MYYPEEPDCKEPLEFEEMGFDNEQEARQSLLNDYLSHLEDLADCYKTEKE